jgi:hypothetical protein
MIIEMPPPFKNEHLVFDFAQPGWQLQQYREVRQRVFCEEQKLFVGSDQDDIDRQAIPIVAISNCMGMLDRVVGVVRIDEREPGLWYGGRLGVMDAYRRTAHFTISGLFDGGKPIAPFHVSVGAALIYKAVSTAKTLGCQQFLANVQAQNVPFFERMHWKPLFVFDMYGVPHARMEANLAQYPAANLATSQVQLTRC